MSRVSSPPPWAMAVMSLLLLPLLLLPCCLAVSPSPGCGLPPPSVPLPGHSKTLYLTVPDPLMGPTEREYILHVPLHLPESNTAPIPLLLDFHWFRDNAWDHENNGHGMFVLADEDPSGGFLLVSGQGMGDVGQEDWWGSWNCSRTDGPLGDICDVDRAAWGDGSTCYDSCGSCDGMHSCDWTTCYNDIVYSETLIDEIGGKYCVDLDSVHLSGLSNGGMFAYYAASRSHRFASIAPVAASPALGFGAPPSWPLSLIDFHGLEDTTIPYDQDHGAVAEGPHGSVVNSGGFYHDVKPTLFSQWSEAQACGPALPWPTPMDGEQGFQCVIHTDCRGGAELVSCTANYGHDYPFGKEWGDVRYMEASRILWQFMAAHPRLQEEGKTVMAG